MINKKLSSSFRSESLLESETTILDGSLSKLITDTNKDFTE